MKVSFAMDLREQVGCQQPSKRTGDCARWQEPPERWHQEQKRGNAQKNYPSPCGCGSGI